MDYDDGDKEGLSGYELDRVTVFSPADFLNPRAWYCDIPIIHPVDVLGWRVGLRVFLESFGFDISVSLVARRGFQRLSLYS